MTVYIMLYFFIFVVTFIVKLTGRTTDKRRNKLCFAIFGAILLVIGLRHSSMGNDLPGYIETFNLSKIFSFKQLYLFCEKYYEFGFIVFIKLCGTILPNETWYLLACAAFSIIPVAVFVAKKKVDPLLAALIYTGLPSFAMLYSALRQSIAFGLCLLSLKFVEEKKPVKFVLMIAFTALFHRSALIFMVCYPAYWVYLNRKNRLYLFPVVIIVYILRKALFSLVAPFFGTSYLDMYESNSFGILFFLCALYLFEIFFMDYRSKEQNGYANILYLACICQTFASVSTVAMRITEYFALILIILLPRTITSQIRSSKNKLIFYIVFSFGFILIGLMFLYEGRNNWSMSYPYHWFWEKIT